jgi:hypothetical protein
VQPVGRAHRNSTISLARIASGPDAFAAAAAAAAPGSPGSPGLSPSRRGSPAHTDAASAAAAAAAAATATDEAPPRELLSTRYADTDPNQPRPVTQQQHQQQPSKPANKMHQTSSRLLRMTDDERPFTRDFNDLFSTLIVSLLPLSPHRVRLTKVEHTFLSEDAINNLGSLKFSQSNRMPDPKDPSRIVTTTTTTTFSMAKDMARVICQRFLEARFIESADGKYQNVYSMKGTVWQLTPKGITVLDRFCSRNGIQQKQVSELAGSAVTSLVLLERDLETDKLVTDKGTMEVIFRRFVGLNGRNVKASVSAADSDSLSDYRDGLTGVKMASERKINGKTYRDTFTGKAAADWLMDCSTTVDRRETVEIGSLFVEYGLMEAVVKDKAYLATTPDHDAFQPTKAAIFQLTQLGTDLINGVVAPRGRSSDGVSAANGSGGGSPAGSTTNGVSSTPRGPALRDSNNQRLDKILNDRALRLLFRENLCDTHCEENLSFYLDVDEFVRQCRAATRTAQQTQTAGRPLPPASLDAIKEIMAQAYGIYNGFLAPGSPCELNIDHQLRNNLATRMTKAVGQDAGMIETLHEVTALFEDAQNAVFKLMASVSLSLREEICFLNWFADSGFPAGLGAQVSPQRKVRADAAPLRPRRHGRRRPARARARARAQPQPLNAHHVRWRRWVVVWRLSRRCPAANAVPWLSPVGGRWAIGLI